MVAWAGCSDQPAGCVTEPCSAIAGYSVVRGTVTRADNTPYVLATRDAVRITCGYAPNTFQYGESTDREGQYRFELEPESLPASRLLPCIVSAGPGPVAADTLNVQFTLTRDTRPTFVVNLRLPG